MSELEKKTQPAPATGGILSFLWQHKAWWILPLAVLLLLVGILYALGHMSAADPEMYPTTQLNSPSNFRAC
jgi:Family of unknown function (DUF5989)